MRIILFFCLAVAMTSASVNNYFLKRALKEAQIKAVPLPKMCGPNNDEQCVVSGEGLLNRVYSSDTITVHLLDGGPYMTAIDVIEQGDADFIEIDVFYGTLIPDGEFKGQKLVLHKEASTPVLKNMTEVTDVPIPLKDVVFIRVKEMKLIKQTDFGKVK